MDTVASRVNCKELWRANIHATDGELGRLKDMYFDDVTWAIRYLIIDTGNWLPGRKVLISPHSLASTEYSGDALALNLSKEQIRNSPDVGSDKPVSKQQEGNLAAYYGWPPPAAAPWIGGGLLASGFTYTGEHYAHTGPAVPPTPEDRQQLTEESIDYDRHLRSVREVTGYAVATADGELGHVEDLVADLRDTRLVSVIIDTSSWPGGTKLSAPVELVDTIRWENRTVNFRATGAQIRRSP